MSEKRFTKADLIAENKILRKKIFELEQLNAHNNHDESQCRLSAVKFLNFFKSNPFLASISELRTGKLIDINDAYVEATGYTAEEAIGKTTMELGIWIEAADRNKMVALIEEGKKFSNFEMQLRTKSGEIITILLSGERFLSGNEECLFAIAVDITKQKQTEKALQESNEKYRLLAEKMTDIVWMQDLNLRTTYVSPSIEAALGFTPEERMAQDVRAQLTPDSLVRAFEKLASELALEQEGKADPARQIIFEAEYYHKDGSLLWFENIISGIRNEQGVLTGLHGVSRNINKRKQADKALQERDILFKKLSFHVPGMIYQFLKRPDGSYCIPFTTEAIRDIFGCSPEDVREDFTPIARAIFPEDFQRVINSIESSAVTMTVWQCEYRVLLPGQPIRWMFGQSTPEKLTNGGILWHGFITDITERKQVEEALRASEKKYRELVDFLPLPLFEIDVQNKIIAVNNALFEAFMYTPEDLEKGIDITQTFLPEDLERLQFNIRQVLDGETIESSEYMGVRKNGSTFPLIAFASPIIIEGKPVGLRGAIIDITERKHAEESIQKANLSLANAQRIAHIGNWEWDIKNKNIYCSDEVYRIMGKQTPPSDMTYEMCLQSVHPEDRTIVKEAFSKATSEGIKSEIEPRIIRADGEVREIHLIMEPICDNNGRTVSVMGITQDVTEKNEAQRELQRARDHLLHAEKLSALGELSAGVAHEILNPLSIIAMELDILRHMENIPASALTEIEICEQHVHRITAITNRLRNLASIPEKQIFPANINDLISNILSLHNSQLKIEGIETETHYQQDLPEIPIDKAKIEEVILNLISNARAAMQGKDNKILKIKTCKEPGNQLKITIADTGTGIKSEHLSKIFNPFFTTKKFGKGTGLGLSIAYSTIKEHGGTLEAENNKWGGSSFHINIPIRPNG